MHPRQASLITAAEDIAEKTAAKGKSGAPTLFKYTDPDTNQDFYLPEKKTTVKSPWSGKSISVKPEKFTMGDVAKEVKEDAAAAKSTKSKKAALIALLQGTSKTAAASDLDGLNDKTWEWQVKAKDELLDLAKEAKAAKLKAATLEDKVACQRIEKQCLEGSLLVAKVFGKVMTASVAADLSPADVSKLKKLRNMGEHTIDGEVWTKMDEEFKVSPHGLKGDYDKGCRWVSFDEVF